MTAGRCCRCYGPVVLAAAAHDTTQVLAVEAEEFGGYISPRFVPDGNLVPSGKPRVPAPLGGSLLVLSQTPTGFGDFRLHRCPEATR